MAKVDNAIILAAGMATRMRPLSDTIHKALLEVGGEILIERQIRQLQATGINDIIVVTGYKAEQFAYLEKKFSIRLIHNTEYQIRNNHSSIYMVKDYLRNTYICSGDNYFLQNPFEKHVDDSYYSAMYADGETSEWCMAVNEDGIITDVHVGGSNSWYMFGHVFWSEEFSRKFIQILEEEYGNPDIKHELWEDIYIRHIAELPMKMRRYTNGFINEFDTVAEYRAFTEGNNLAKIIAAQALKVMPSDIENVAVMKAGMTNKSYSVTFNGEKYIVRLPGEGTKKLLNRQREAAVYVELSKYNIADDVIYINPDTGCKVTKFIDDCRNCNSDDRGDVAACMANLRKFHEYELSVDSEFDIDIFAMLEHYEDLANNSTALHSDYSHTKEKIIELKRFIDDIPIEKKLSHFDAVADNFLICENGDIRIIDWEYAGNCDPHVDIAMFAVYSSYDKHGLDFLIDRYFNEKCSDLIRAKIYCYAAVCGLLWSNWCDYKLSLGIDYGEYALKQYWAAKYYADVS